MLFYQIEQLQQEYNWHNLGIYIKSHSMSHSIVSHPTAGVSWGVGGGGAAGDACCCGGCCCSFRVSVVAMSLSTARNPKCTKKHEETLAANWIARPGKRKKDDKEGCREVR